MNYIVRQTQLQAIRGNNCHYGQIKNLDTNKTFSWVYDCGHKDLISKIKNNDKINLIVLSHFDKDHIGGAYELMQKNPQARCVAPYIDEQLGVLLLCANIDSYDDNSFDFITELLFSSGTETENFIFMPEGEENRNKTSQITKYIDNAIGSDFWILLPIYYYNPNFQQFRVIADGILKEFKSLKEILEKLKKDRKNFQKKLIEKYKNLIQETFVNKSIVVTPNLLSVCMYSGLSKPCGPKIGWLHTGDTNLSNQKWFGKFNLAFSKYKSNIGIISLPHHGAASSHNPKLFDEYPCALYILPYHRVKQADFSELPFIFSNRYHNICEYIRIKDNKISMSLNNMPYFLRFGKSHFCPFCYYIANKK